jgi:hypothetical protein
MSGDPAPPYIGGCYPPFKMYDFQRDVYNSLVQQAMQSRIADLERQVEMLTKIVKHQEDIGD